MLTRADCRVAPPGSRDYTALRLLGVDVEAIEQASATPLRTAVAAALAGVRTTATKRNPHGVSRGALIRRCSRQCAVKVGDAFDVEPVCCRQRPCPCCARARARKNAAALQRAMQHRRAVASSMFLFATLTQAKRPRHDEGAKEAVHRIASTWRQITNSKHAVGRRFRELFVGGLRTTETTWAARGDEQHNGGGVVAFSGYHAHLHVILEVREGVDRSEAAAWLISTWLRYSAGASAAGQCVRPASADDAHQLCKYVTKPLEAVGDKPAILRELFGALHGVRLLQAFGEWQGKAGVRAGWRELGEPELAKSDVPRWRGPTIGTVLRYATAKLRPLGTTDRVAFVGVKPGDEIMVSAEHAWTMIELAVAERARARGPTIESAHASDTAARARAPSPSS